jgi:hypothetical protein
LGFKFRVQEILLRGYVAFAEELGDRHIRTRVFLNGPTRAIPRAAPQPAAHRATVCAGDAG